MHEMTDDKIREKVRAWLKDNKYTQEKLATKLGLKGQSLRAQMSKKPISAKTKLALMNLIPQIFSNEHQELEDLPFVENLGKMFITLEPNIQDLVHQEAYRLGLTVTAYCSLAVEYAASNEEMRTEISSLHVSKKKSHSFNTDTTSPVVIGEGNAPSSNPLHQTTTTQGEDH